MDSAEPETPLEVEVPEADGLIAYFPFDDPDNPLLDPIGGHVATIVGAAAASTADAAPLSENVGSLLVTGGFASIPDSNEFDFDSGSAMTIAFWFKATQSRGINHLLGKRAGCGAMNYQFARDGGLLHVNSDRGQASVRVATGIDIAVGEWMHFAAAYDGAGNLRVHIDGVERAARSGYVLGPTNSAPILLGGSGSCGSSHRGFLDEVRFYDRALSASEIGELARSRANAWSHRSRCTAGRSRNVLSFRGVRSAERK